MSDCYDLVIIGGGPGGYVAGIRASQLGLRAAVVERDKLGGRCLNYACIPAKAVLRSADVFAQVRDAATYGVALGGEPAVDFGAVAKRRDRVIRTMTGGVRALMKQHGIDVIEGSGALAAAAGGGAMTAAGAGAATPGSAAGHTVTIETAEGPRSIGAASVILATGSVPLPLRGVEFGDRVADTAATWLLGERPASLAVIGAGPSGVEVASAFGRLGTAVTLYELADQILPGEDAEIAAIAAVELAKQNVTIVTGARIGAITPGASAVEVAVEGGAPAVFDLACIAAGRAPDIAGLGLEAAGVAVDPTGRVAVDPLLRSSLPGVFAIGDLVAGPALAHKASEEGVIAAELAAGADAASIRPLAHGDIPRVTFSSPQVASFGLTEAQAAGAGVDPRVGRFPLAAAGAATVYGDRAGLVKLIGDGATGELLGAHIVCAKAAEMIAELAVARAAEVGYNEIARTVHAHPTFSEAVLEASRAAAGWAIHA